MADKTIEEFILKQGYNPYPLVRYTERADVAATHILEGHVLIYVDTSPSVIITPTTIFHHMQHVEEYRQSPGVGTFVKMGTVYWDYYHHFFFLPIVVIICFRATSLLPEKIAFIGPNELNEYSRLLFKFFLLILGLNFYEWLQYIPQHRYQQQWD